MQLISNIGGVLALAFAALAMFTLRSVVLFRADVAMCIWAFTSTLAICFGLYVVTLRNRIAALEKRLSERE